MTTVFAPNFVQNYSDRLNQLGGADAQDATVQDVEAEKVGSDWLFISFRSNAFVGSCDKVCTPPPASTVSEHLACSAPFRSRSLRHRQV